MKRMEEAMKRSLLALVLLSLSCASFEESRKDEERGRLMRHTSNPQATAGCKLIIQLTGLGSVEEQAARAVHPKDTRQPLIFIPGGRQPAELYMCDGGS